QGHRLGPHPAALLPVAHAEPLDSPVRRDAVAREADRRPGGPWLPRLHCPETETNPALLPTTHVAPPGTAVALLAMHCRFPALAGSDDGVLRLYDLTTQERVQAFSGHMDWVLAAAVTADGQAVSGSLDHTLRVWDLTSGQCRRTLQGHTGNVTGVAVTADGGA